MIAFKPLALAICCLALGTQCFAAPKRPNIVVLVADDWGYSDVGSFGSEIATPNIDTLAREGVRFSDFHVTASCSPTRSMLMTGVDNHRNGVGNMPETMPDEHLGKPGYSGVLNDNAITVASQLKDGGYHTYITGKWHLGKTADTLPNNRGFERSFIQADSGSDNWEERPYAPLYDKAAWFENGQPAHLPKDYYSSTFIVDKAMEYIAADRKDGQPFFAYLGFQANHVPVQAPKDVIDKYRGRYDQGWTALRQARRERAIELGLIPAGSGMQTMASTADWDALDEHEKRYEARRMEVYAGMGETMDREIGRLIAHLKATGDYDNTVFVFLSDNGSEPTDPYAIPAIRLWLEMHYTRELDRLGSKGAFTSIGPSWASAAASPLSGYKFFAGEGGLRTPLIVSGVPSMQTNRIVKAFTHVTDIVPTLLDVAGVAAHSGEYQGRAVEPMIGNSLVPVLKGTTDRVHPEDQAIGYELSGSAALFKGDYKLVKSLKPVGNEQWHLYNIATDPGEVNDLQQQMPERFVSMQADYAEYARLNGVLPMPAGYDYMHQGQMYALKHVVMPKLKAAAPPIAAVLLLLVGVLVWRRRRKQAV
ncbi:arylsulfatase [Pseudomonas sp. 10S4]|uniref:arylsulfatase n=1 Tax=Pseudomonas sp. 10S4 TaxID=3048583 RepID=UPI002AC9E1D9|nr:MULTISPECIES: arylsulfatase [unclassified Pseudomonas]MEB0225004.1 arylsulfatase [Pseudomonas sp. 5S1]MEB0296158.1 arylsulfatase [Pseudomonas sp. 10S4]WPX16563.1 arylsulfatase [Pseudomonas sp. 10S4]